MQPGQMKLSLLVVAAFLPFLNAKEQQAFYPQKPEAQTIVPYHHQPSSLLLSQTPNTCDCVVLSEPAPAQVHRSIINPTDVLVINKTVSSVDGFEIIDQHVMEVIGYDERILWTKTNQICVTIQHVAPETEDTSAEFEVVCPHMVTK